MHPSVSRTRSTGRVTLNEVAAQAGVSPMTASRALRGARAVAPDLIARVQAAAAKLGYVPDPAARALASRHSSHVAVLIPMLSNALFVDVIEAIQRSLRAKGFQMLMGVTHYDANEEEHLLREQLQHRPAGLLVTGYERNDATQKLISQSGVPCVHMMEATPRAGKYCVGLSQFGASAEMTRHLLASGKRRIAFAAAQMDARTLERLEGWRAEMRQAGLHEPKLEWLNHSASSLALGGQMLGEIMAQRPAVDAIFFCNDDLAQGALLAALKLGIQVPRQVAIAGFNDLTGSDQMWPPLTTIRTPRSEIGSAAANMLLSLIAGQQPAQPCADLGYQLIVRASA